MSPFAIRAGLAYADSLEARARMLNSLLPVGRREAETALLRQFGIAPGSVDWDDDATGTLEGLRFCIGKSPASLAIVVAWLVDDVWELTDGIADLGQALYIHDVALASA